MISFNNLHILSQLQLWNDTVIEVIKVLDKLYYIGFYILTALYCTIKLQGTEMDEPVHVWGRFTKGIGKIECFISSGTASHT